MNDRRDELRIRVRLSVQIMGIDNRGKRFVENAVATNISRGGALLSEVGVSLRCGDYLAVKYRERRANFRIIWSHPSRTETEWQIAVQKLDDQPCPWEDVLADVLARPATVLETGYAELDRRLRECWGLDFDETLAPLWVFDRTTLAFLAVNDSAVRIYGYSREEFLAMTILDIQPREDIRSRHNAELGPREANGELERWQHRTKDGVLMNVELTARPLIFEGRPAELIAVCAMEPASPQQTRHEPDTAHPF